MSKCECLRIFLMATIWQVNYFNEDRPFIVWIVMWILSHHWSSFSKIKCSVNAWELENRKLEWLRTKQKMRYKSIPYSEWNLFLVYSQFYTSSANVFTLWHQRRMLQYNLISRQISSSKQTLSLGISDFSEKSQIRGSQFPEISSVPARFANPISVANKAA